MDFAKMNQAIKGDSSSAPVALPLKRRRGRPRKDPSLKRVGRPQAPPRFELVQEIQPQQVDRNNSNDGMIGQAVTGVVEAAFDAGYLLSVRIGDSNTNYRGVVFKPGHFVPVTAENDVAPHVQMIRRNVVHPPAKNQLQVYGHRAEQNGALILGSRSSKSKQASITMHPSVPPVGARGTVVPVVLQPVNLANGLGSSQGPHGSSHASHAESVRERGVQMVAPLAMLPPDGPVTSSQVPPPVPTHETYPSQTQVSDKVAIGTGQKEDGSLSMGGKDMQLEEVKPMVSTNVTIPVEVTKGSQGSAQSPKTNTPVIPERRDMNHFTSAEPSESANPPLHTQATSVSNPLMNYGSGRMTELLQAVQENSIENQLFHAEESGHAVTNPETDSSKQETSVQ